jgi:hypothetical protein
VDDLKNKSLGCMVIWMKMMMKQVIAVVEKGIEFIAYIRNIEFFIYGH